MERAREEAWDILLSKEVWLATLGVAVAIARWQGWDIPLEVFAAIEALIIAVIGALSRQ